MMQDLARRERFLLSLARPFLTKGSKYDAYVASVLDDDAKVTRGKKHEPLEDEVLIEELEAVPSRRDDLLAALDSAYKLIRAADKRNGDLDFHYYEDLKAYRAKHGQQSRKKFDRQFFRDRAQAMEDLAVAERDEERIRNRMKDERLRQLQDMTSDFETQVSESLSWSEGTLPRERRRLRIELDREVVDEYLGQIQDDGLVDPLGAGASVPSYEHESEWDARPVDVNDVDNAASTEGAGTQEGRRIREYRAKMERVREEEDKRRRNWRSEEHT